MYDQLARGDEVVARLAARQHGVVSVGQMRAAGLDKHDVLHRARTARLHRVHRGVYAVGHVGISREGRWMAAVLACASSGEREAGAVLRHWGAALSFRSAATLWGLLPMTDGPVDVSVPCDGGRAARVGIRLHRCLSLSAAEVTLHHGIPITSPARTIADLRRAASGPSGRGLVSTKELRRAIRQADALGLPIGLEDGPDRSRSGLERLFLRLCRRHDLPFPEHNVWIGGHEVDFLWRAEGLVVETDGYRFHRGRAAFEDDRARDLALRGIGFQVVRLSERQVATEPARVAEVLRAAIASARLRVGGDGREPESRGNRNGRRR